MCGISGLFLKNSGVEMGCLEKMAASTRHRGPDNTGYYISLGKDIGLVHNRLSIIDLSPSGNQPMASADGNVHIVFNGEIYNFIKLREELIARGYSFKSNSDSEVLLAMYLEYGVDMLEHLNGMFAFCIYDERNSKLFLVRDRVGIKPVYYAATQDGFVFGSELKPLINSGMLTDTLNPDAVNAFTLLGYIPFDMAIFKDSAKLLPGHYLLYDLKAGTFKTERYWNLPEAECKKYSEPELLEELEFLLNDSVSLRMISDVPIGCFLSGGVDSSLCAAVMARNSSKAIKTFNISFDNEKYNESAYAKIVAESIGSEHIEHAVKLDAIEALNHIINNYDEPFADSSMIPTYFVSKVAREHVTVVLSGDGGDELFGGYNWYSWMLALDDMKKKLPLVNKPLSAVAGMLPFNFRGKHFLSSLRKSHHSQFQERIGFFKPGELLNNDGDAMLDVMQRKFNSFGGDLLRKMTCMDFNCYLPEDILTKVDRASMAVSLEARVPWLDHRLAEFAFRLPSDWRIRDKRKKYLPKELGKKLLPDKLKLERKQGFSIPLASWMKSELGEWLGDVAGYGEPYFDKKDVLKYLDEHRAGRKNHGAKLYAMLMFILWKRKFSN